MSHSPPIRIWPFDHAPEELRQQSTNGGDEDWLIHVPVGYMNEDLPWLENNAGFGSCSVDPYPQPDGSCVYIGCHA